MNNQYSTARDPLPGSSRGRGFSRRAFLGRLAGGAGALAITGAAGWSTQHQRAAAQTPATPASAVGTRRPGAPTVAEQAAALGHDVTAIFRFVADQVRYEAYEGGLRGPTGTLWGMAGNSVDQAQLLAALLQAAGVKTRFATGSLDDAGVARLVQAMTGDPQHAHDQDEKILVAPSTPSATPAALTRDERARLAALAAQRQNLIAAARAELAGTVKTIQEGLTSTGIVLPTPQTALPERERTQHIWVQYADGAVWTDLDPTFPGEPLGKSPAAVAATPDTLPADLFHQIAIRLTVETVSGGQPVRSDALTFQTHCQDLVAVPVTLVQAPPQITGQAVVATGAQPYIPTLIVGSQGLTGKPFALATGGGLGALGGLGGPTEGDTLAEWLNIDLIAPGGQKTTVSRAIFDRVGAVARASGQVDLSSVPPATLTQVGGAGQFYLPLMGITSIAVVGEKVPWTYFQQDYRIADQLADLTNASHGHHYIRDVLMLETRDDTGFRFYPDGPNVTAVTLVPTAVAADSATMAANIDIIARSAAAVPVTAKPALPPLVAAGVLAQVAERTLAEGATGQVQNAPPTTSVGVGSVFDEAAKEAIPIRTLAPRSAVPPDLTVSDLARLEIGAALQAGDAVIVPARPVTFNGASVIGWWRVDPRTGQTVDVMEGGQGQEETEYITLLGEVFKTILEAEHLGWCIAGFGAAISLVIFIIMGEGAGKIGAAGLFTIKGGVACATSYIQGRYLGGH